MKSTCLVFLSLFTGHSCVPLIDVTQHVCVNDSTSQFLDRLLGGGQRRTFGHLFNDCTNYELLPSGNESGATSCFGGWRYVSRVCGASIDLQMPNDDVCAVEAGRSTPCSTGLPYPSGSVGPGIDWRMYYGAGLIQACAVLDNGVINNTDGIDPSLSSTSVNFLCSVDRDWSYEIGTGDGSSSSDSSSDDSSDEDDLYFTFTYCWIGGTERTTNIVDDPLRGEGYYYQEVIDTDCSNGLPSTNDDDNVLCVASLIDVTYAGAEEDVIVAGLSFLLLCVVLV